MITKISGFDFREKISKCDSLFVSMGGFTPGEPLTTRGLRSILKKIGEKSGVENVLYFVGRYSGRIGISGYRRNKASGDIVARIFDTALVPIECLGTKGRGYDVFDAGKMPDDFVEKQDDGSSQGGGGGSGGGGSTTQGGDSDQTSSVSADDDDLIKYSQDFATAVDVHIEAGFVPRLTFLATTPASREPQPAVSIVVSYPDRQLPGGV
ncbi:MAG: hypothetical protein IAE62_01170, partial [Flavobacteriales bacterium]|nr:hypothetical protein [Flavobacteriales bacterium]